MHGGRRTHPALPRQQSSPDNDLPPDGPGDCAMTLMQLTALYLIPAGAPVSLADLARALGTERPATLGIVDGLVHAGLVRRRDDARHGGHVAVILTPIGKALIDGPGADTAARLQTVLMC